MVVADGTDACKEKNKTKQKGKRRIKNSPLDLERGWLWMRMVVDADGC